MEFVHCEGYGKDNDGNVHCKFRGSFQCHFCQRGYYQLKNLKKHIRTHLGNTEPMKALTSFTCEDCKKIYFNITKLQIHILSVHHGIKYQCEQCHRTFPSQENLSHHKCKGELSCLDCGKVFYRRYLLNKHSLTHSNTSLRCKYCYTTFVKQKFYDAHIKKLNCSKTARNYWFENYNSTQCRECLLNFCSEKSLVDHFKLNHIGYPYQCYWCSTQLPSILELKRHVHFHNVERYTCIDCNKSYTSQEGYRKHKIKHLKTPFQCQYCQKQYLSQRRAELHQAGCDKKLQVDKNLTIVSKKNHRQVNWESRIIVKKVRGTEEGENQPRNSNINFVLDNDEDSLSDRQGWFDEYYKTVDDNSITAQEPQYTQLSECEREIITDVVASGSSDDSTDVSGDDVEQNIEFDPKLCRVCGLAFSLEYELLHHFIKNHPDEIPHQCPHCEERAPLFAQLKEHLKKHGIGLGVFHCGYCSKSFLSESRAKRHTARCRGDVAGWPDTKTCRGCGKTFQTKCGYKKHKRTSCKRENKSLSIHQLEVQGVQKTGSMEGEPPTYSDGESCNAEECIQQKDEKDKLDEKISKKENTSTQTVIASFTEKSQKICLKPDILPELSQKPADSKFECRLCPSSFPYERGLVMHFKTHHPGNKPLICPECGIALADKLKEHLKTHGIGEEFICELCGKRFNQKFMSKIHELWHEGIEYKCSNCNQKFLTEEKMKRHVEMTKCLGRASLMLLPCELCGKRYRSRYSLKCHYLTHTPKELRPVKRRLSCEFCGKWFENNNALQRHRRIHTGEKPYCCRFCPKTFAQEGNCKAHERLHTGESNRKVRKKQETEQASTITNIYAACSAPQAVIPPHML